jgi:hypothetical protein
MIRPAAPWPMSAPRVAQGYLRGSKPGALRLPAHLAERRQEGELHVHFVELALSAATPITISTA